ncbi:toxin co-regulated pilus biosynthesis Q family protein [Pandoraea anhela]|uniref:Type IV pilus assembly protein n=1 Tax=Pandoraea anhela TaxID=2508295 RepID=A0A5E4SNZ7_9BURK|nr:toxin co-regulated pilus biosynthesis Q family protein [Pandoraea anhela]VVD76652.1 type IV pilus assembly protein [Pandoraea anhela]
MTHSGMRVALVAVMCAGVLPLARTAGAAPQTDVTWMFASHKPLMQSAGARERAEPAPDASHAQTVDDARRYVQAEPAPVLPAGPPVALTPPPAAFELALRPSDGRVSQAVRRFAERHGWQLAWEIDRDFPIEYPATFQGDFLGVVEQVVRSLQNTDAPIRVKVYEANRVLRVVHATQ